MASVSMEYELPNIFNSYPINRKNTLSTMSQGFPCRYFIKPLREYLSLRGMEGLFTSETLTVFESSILEVLVPIASILAIVSVSSNHACCGSVTQNLLNLSRVAPHTWGIIRTIWECTVFKLNIEVVLLDVTLHSLSQGERLTCTAIDNPVNLILRNDSTNLTSKLVYINKIVFILTCSKRERRLTFVSSLKQLRKDGTTMCIVTNDVIRTNPLNRRPMLLSEHQSGFSESILSDTIHRCWMTRSAFINSTLPVANFVHRAHDCDLL